MNEIEKLYKNANVKPVCDGLDCFICTAECNNGKYPEFTAEKQIELLKICFDKYGEIGKVTDVDRCILYVFPNAKEDRAFIVTDYINFETWEETIAGLINNLWQDLTEDEKQQIREILE